MSVVALRFSLPVSPERQLWRPRLSTVVLTLTYFSHLWTSHVTSSTANRKFFVLTLSNDHAKHTKLALNNAKIIRCIAFYSLTVLSSKTWGSPGRTRTWSPRTRIRTYKLILEDPRGQGLSSRTTTLLTYFLKRYLTVMRIRSWISFLVVLCALRL